MGEEIELRNSARELCDVFGLLHDVKNERQLLNIVFLAQRQKIMDEIYSDFRFSDLGPFSPNIDFDLELLKLVDILEESDDPKNTIYLTSLGKEKCVLKNGKIHDPKHLQNIKKMDIEDLIDINRYIYLRERFDLNNDDFGKMKDFFKCDDKQIERLKINVKELATP